MALLALPESLLMRSALCLDTGDLCTLDKLCRRFHVPLEELGMLSITEAAARVHCFRLPGRCTLPRGLLWKQLLAPAGYDCAAQCRNFALPDGTRSTISCRFNHDGSLIASSHGDHTIKVTDFRTGRVRHTLAPPPLTHPRTPWTVAWHPTKPSVLASGCLGFRVNVWDISNQDLPRRAMTDMRAPIISVCFDPTGTVLSIVSGVTVHFWRWEEEGAAPLLAWRGGNMLRCLVFTALPPPPRDAANEDEHSATDAATDDSANTGARHSTAPNLIRSGFNKLCNTITGGSSRRASSPSMGKSENSAPASVAAPAAAPLAALADSLEFGAVIGEQMPARADIDRASRRAQRQCVRLRWHRFVPALVGDSSADQNAYSALGDGQTQVNTAHVSQPHHPTMSFDPGAVDVTDRALLYNDGGLAVSGDGSRIVCCAARGDTPSPSSVAKGAEGSSSESDGGKCDDGELIVLSLAHSDLEASPQTGTGSAPHRESQGASQGCYWRAKLLGTTPLSGPSAGGVTSVRLSASGRHVLLGHGVREEQSRSRQSEKPTSSVASLYAMFTLRRVDGAGFSGANVGDSGNSDSVDDVCGHSTEKAAGPVSVDQVSQPSALVTNQLDDRRVQLWKMLEVRSKTDDANLALFHPVDGASIVYGTIQGKLRAIDFAPDVGAHEVVPQEQRCSWTDATALAPEDGASSFIGPISRNIVHNRDGAITPPLPHASSDDMDLTDGSADPESADQRVWLWRPSPAHGSYDSTRQQAESSSFEVKVMRRVQHQYGFSHLYGNNGTRAPTCTPNHQTSISL